MNIRSVVAILRFMWPNYYKREPTYTMSNIDPTEFDSSDISLVISLVYVLPYIFFYDACAIVKYYYKSCHGMLKNITRGCFATLVVNESWWLNRSVEFCYWILPISCCYQSYLYGYLKLFASMYFPFKTPWWIARFKWGFSSLSALNKSMSKFWWAHLNGYALVQIMNRRCLHSFPRRNYLIPTVFTTKTFTDWSID